MATYLGFAAKSFSWGQGVGFGRELSRTGVGCGVWGVGRINKIISYLLTPEYCRPPTAPCLRYPTRFLDLFSLPYLWKILPKNPSMPPLPTVSPRTFAIFSSKSRSSPVTRAGIEILTVIR